MSVRTHRIARHIHIRSSVHRRRRVSVCFIFFYFQYLCCCCFFFFRLLILLVRCLCVSFTFHVLGWRTYMRNVFKMYRRSSHRADLLHIHGWPLRWCMQLSTEKVDEDESKVPVCSYALRRVDICIPNICIALLVHFIPWAQMLPYRRRIASFCFQKKEEPMGIKRFCFGS